MLNFIKKNKKLIIRNSLKPKVFLVLFSLFFSSLAFAAALTVTWLYSKQPGNPNALGCFTHPNLDHPSGERITTDGVQEPEDIAFSNDGLTYFIANKNIAGGYDITVYKLTSPFDLNTILNDCTQDRFDLGVMARGDGSGPLANGWLNSEYGRLYDMEFSPSGHKIFIVNGLSYLMQFSLSTPFDLKTAKFDTWQDLSPNAGSVAFNRDGTKMFWLEGGGNDSADTTKVETYDLGSPFDITSLTLVHTLDLSGTALNSASGNQFSVDMNFNDTGSAFYILIADGGDRSRSAIYQFSLEKNYDMSTASLVGSSVVSFNGASGLVTGFGFGDGGMKLYVINALNGSATVDQTSVYQLECPYGIVACVSDASATVVSQVELANQNISLNVSTIFKRFEWIKRNRDNEDLISHNININYPNPLLSSLVNKFEPSFKNNLATLVSNTLNKEEKKKSKWSSWSIVDVSIGDYKETFLDKAKGIKTKGITFGSDRKIGDDKFFGLALRYGNSASNIRRTVQNVDLESYTLNFYGIVPTNNNQYINAVLGLSALRYDNEYLGKLSGERNGKQAFASINYRTKNAYSKFNITPTGKLTFGVTELSEFTDFISKAADRPATDIRFHEDTIVSGEFAGGLLFEMEKIESEGTTTQPMGGIEIIYDLADDNTYKYSNVGSTVVNKETINSYSNKKLKTNISFEHIVENGLTILFDYENIMSLGNCERCYSGVSQNFNNETFIIKISKSKKDNTQFVFDFDPLSNNSANLSYVKDINNLNLKLNSNMNLLTRSPDYGANIEISGKF